MNDELPVAFAAPLAGVHSIEASAGTGKTWTIAWLYVRLVVERGLPADAVLVVTFTKAATAELRERVRERLQQVLDRIAGAPAADAHVERFVAGLADADLAQRRLVAALRGFDEAPIQTIHGFCQRALADSALASRMPFEFEVLPEIGDLVAALAADFWRARVAAPGADEQFVAWLLERSVSPATLACWARPLLSKHGLELRLAAAPAGGEAAARGVVAAWSALGASWRRERAAVLDILTQAPGLDRRRYRRDRLPGWADAVDDFLGESAMPWSVPEQFGRFARSAIALAVRQGQPPSHPFFDAVEAFVAEHALATVHLQWRFGALRRDLLEWLRAQLPVALGRRRMKGYDDLLQDLHAALAGARGERLAAALRRRYPAALVDEFQDTDRLQYAIFRRIWIEQGGEAAALYLVGDPKQAIYGFRGADLHAYLEATRDCASGFGLVHNQRAVEPLIRALNTLYAAAPQPFLIEDIRYRAVRPGAREHAPLIESGATGAARAADATPLRFLVRASGDAPLGKPEARAWAAQASAAEIARLLGGAARGEILRGSEALAARDIAVLVGNRYHAQAVREALAQHGIACAQRSRESVFHSDEAEQIERLLAACAEPQREALARGAFAGDLFGCEAGRIASWDETPAGEADLDARLERLRGWAEVWRRQGVMAMLRRLLRAEGALERLAGFADGERRLTNLHHLAELLHEEEAARAHAPAALLRWLASRRREPQAGEQAQLRLESDENLVQLVTIHAAKGLEYPLTFLPFLWDLPASPDAAEGVVFHDPAAGHLPVIDLSPNVPDAARAAADEAARAEQLRVAYVALTRASNRCTLCWARIKDAEHSALGWLLHQGAAAPDDAALRARLTELGAASAGAIALFEAPDEAVPAAPAQPAAAEGLAARTFAATIPAPWRVASYSSLAAGFRHDWSAERPDHDARRVDALQAAVAAGGRFGFPRGAEAGDCLHRMLERIDLRASEAAWLPTIREELARAGLAGESAPAVAAWLGEVARTPLACCAPDFSLSMLAPRAMLRELEFHLPAARCATLDLRALLARHAVAVPDLEAAVLDGYLKGYIDLVFRHAGRWYVADWKSNWLGADEADYGPAALGAVMDASGYRLQYLIYCLALHRWLRSRDPGYDYASGFGGALYLFLRGMRADAGAGEAAPAGVFFVKPPVELIEALDACLGGAGLRP